MPDVFLPPTLAFLWTFVSGHPDAALLKMYADSARVPVAVAWAVATVESGVVPNNAARGRHGEIGRMQMQPQHAPAFIAECGTKPLTDYHTNLCKGMFLLRSHYLRTRDWRAAILRYNGSGPATEVYLLKVEREIGRMWLRLESLK